MTHLYMQQDTVAGWVIDTFGEPFLRNKKERCFRALEECLECVQSGGLTRGDALRVIEQVYSKLAEPDISKEIGGALHTMCALAFAFEVETDDALDFAIKDAWDRQDQIRAKQKLKVGTTAQELL